MNVLDNPQKIRQIDKSNVYGSIEALPQQCVHAWNDVEKINIPSHYKNFNQVVVCGMGGSNLGAHLIQALFENDLKIPLLLDRDYHLPSFVNEHTLIILSSYSGTTEETISCAEEVVERKLKACVIATGGKLGEMARTHHFPFYQIKPKYNPSNQPRMAIGYSVFGQIALFAKLGLIKVTKKDALNLKKYLTNLVKRYSIKVKSSNNPAKKLATKAKDKIINLVAAEHLQGTLHVFNNQLNENSKNFSNYFYLPELNHHLMEGLQNPPSMKKNAIFVFFDSALYSDKIQKRLKLTIKVVEKNKLTTEKISLKANNKLNQCFELITIGAYTNFYLSILYGIDPAPIPWVDYFKEELKKLK